MRSQQRIYQESCSIVIPLKHKSWKIAHHVFDNCVQPVATECQIQTDTDDVVFILDSSLYVVLYIVL